MERPLWASLHRLGNGISAVSVANIIILDVKTMKVVGRTVKRLLPATMPVPTFAAGNKNIEDMGHKTLIMLSAIALLLGVAAPAPAQAQSRETTFQLKFKSNQGMHTGDVYMNVLASSDYCMTTNFLFEKGSRGRWHVHPDAVQTMLVLSGEAYYQEEGQPKRLLKKGDVVSTPANVKHWNGATPWSDCECLTITDKVPGKQHAIQMEEVTDEEFNAPIPENNENK